jgi:nitroreductase
MSPPEAPARWGRGASVDAWQAINTIRVVREFSSRPVPREHIERIVDAGRRAGSSKNLQRWDFVVVSERDRLRKLAEAGSFAGHVAEAAFAVALVTPDPKKPDRPLSVVWDSGRASQNKVLAAWQIGIGSAPATVHHHGVVEDLLALPPDHHCEFILAFGYPADESVLIAPNKPGGRRSLEEVMHDETW